MVVICFKELFQHLRGWTEENHEDGVSRDSHLGLIALHPTDPRCIHYTCSYTDE
jgi:hypothetical protein